MHPGGGVTSFILHLYSSIILTQAWCFARFLPLMVVGGGGVHVLTILILHLYGSIILKISLSGMVFCSISPIDGWREDFWRPTKLVELPLTAHYCWYCYGSCLYQRSCHIIARANPWASFNFSRTLSWLSNYSKDALHGAHSTVDLTVKLILVWLYSVQNA